MDKTRLRKIAIQLGSGAFVLLSVVAVFIAIHIYYYNLTIVPLEAARRGHVQKNIWTLYNNITNEFNAFYDLIADNLQYEPQNIMCCRDSAYAFCRLVEESDSNAVGAMIETRKGAVKGVKGDFWPSCIRNSFRNEAEVPDEDKLFPGRNLDNAIWKEGNGTIISAPVYSKACGSRIVLFSLSRFDAKGTFALFSIAVDTEAETDRLRKKNPYPDGNFFVIDRNDRFIMNSAAESKDDLDAPAAEWLDEKFGKNIGLLVDSTFADGNFHETQIEDWGTFAVTYYDPVFKNCYVYIIPLWSLVSDIFEIYDKIFIAALLAVIIIFIICIANMRKMSSMSARESALSRDLETAADIQQSMLTNQCGNDTRIDADTRLVPAKFVGGDLYCCLTRGDKLFFCIGDVAGKGIPAALHSSKCVSLFKNMTGYLDSAAAITSALNNEMCADNSQCMFVSTFIAILDLNTGNLNYCNAGHEKPLYWSGKEDEKPCYVGLVSDNLVLGASEDFPFKEGNFTMEEGSVLTQFTDGVDEAMNPADEQFGKIRLIETFSKNSRKSAKELNDSITSAVSGFVGKHEQSDDITLVTIRYRSPK